MKKVVGALTGGIVIWAAWFCGGLRGMRAEVFAWVADRDAGRVVALDQDLRELETWVIPRPTALVDVDDGVLVKGTLCTTEGAWWCLESGSLPVRCAAPEGDLDMRPESGRSISGLHGVPTAWAIARDRVLIATPGAVHLTSKGGALQRVQGGFRWISAVALSGQTSPKGRQGEALVERAAQLEPRGS